MLTLPMKESGGQLRQFTVSRKELSQNCHRARQRVSEGVCNFLILWWPLEDSNLQPKDYESSALPLS
jgi:hypothetical protein